MIGIEVLCRRLPGVPREELERWVANAWLRSSHGHGFEEIDLARALLIQELRTDLGLDDEVLPLVLSLLDQLYQTRHQLLLLCEAVDRSAPGEIRDRIQAALRQALGGTGTT